MPQLDTATFAPQIVWLAITFIALYVVLAVVVLPRIGDVLAIRQDKIAHDLESAESLKADAETAMAAYESTLAEARDKAHGLLTEAAEKLNAEAAARRQDLGAKLAEEGRAAEAEIATVQKAASKNVRAIAGETARAAVKLLIGVAVDDKTLKRALRAAKRESG
ncbi:MAG: F0F1 ATP synthase subunit B' [Alphaproteobacteria bacterium]